MADIIPEEKVLEIRNAVDIVDVISEVVHLKKAGKSYVGLCPFHTEKTPSFTVSAVKQIFYCFGCGVGGNLFRFLMKRDGLSFPEAVRAMANRAGIDLPHSRLTPAQKRRVGEREQLLAANRKAADFFVRALTRSKAGESAMGYLIRRGIHREIIEEFQLGYAPGGWDVLIRELGKEGVAPPVLEKAGLIVARDNRPGHYDRFRERIMFPICNLSRQVIAFGGRVMDDTLPKYLNSPETPVYSKSRTLYGLNLARSACRQTGEVYVVEGYFDLLALFTAGMRNAVATLGTALTESHVRMLRGIADTVMLVFDADAAGLKAAARCGELFIREAVEARIVLLPAGDDPDSFLAREGARAFRETAGRASGVFTFLVESAVAHHGTTIEGKIRAVDDLLPHLAGISDPVARSLYVKELAEQVGIDEQPLLERVQEAARSIRKGSPEVQRQSAPRDEGPPSGRSHRQRFERQIIAMMLQFPQILTEIETRGTLAHFEDSDLRSIGRHLLTHFQRNPHSENVGESAADLVDRIVDERQQRLAARLAIDERPWELKGCLRLLEQFDISRRRGSDPLLAEIKAAEAAGDEARLLKLLQDKQKRAKANQQNPAESSGGAHP